DLFRLSSTGVRLRPVSHAAAVRVHRLLGLSGFSGLLHAPGPLQTMRGAGRRSAMGYGEAHLDKVHMHFLGHWARKLSWKETAEEFRTSWDKVHDAVAYLVTWGLEHRVLGAIRAIGVDEIQRGKGHKYLTLVYQIDLDCTRLLWIGKERTVKTFREFFNMIGPEVSAKIEFVCSDMWKPYLGVIREMCSQALNILDRFPIVAK